jgi:hypothetical protein
MGGNIGFLAAEADFVSYFIIKKDISSMSVCLLAHSFFHFQTLSLF